MDAENIREMSLHGMNKDAWNRFGKDGYKSYEVRVLGYKYNMTDIHASIGIHQLARINESWLKRKKIWLK